jgi:pilus assembly protein FimV
MMRKKLAAKTNLKCNKTAAHPQWRATAVSFAAAALLSLAATNAFSLALGRVTVQSALGEPLRAEVEVPEINADEAATLRAAVAAPDSFKAAGLEYNPALSGLSITLLRRPDGKMYLRVTSDRPISDPFVDLILEVTWASGRIVRDYTMLFDPPNLRQAAVPVVVPQVSATAGAATMAIPSNSGTSARSVTPMASAGAGTPKVRPAKTPAEPRAVAPPAVAGGQQVTVKSGDTATRIAAANKPTTLSLDQMLVALLRANPDAFSRGNLNRLRSGAVLNIPTAEQAGQMSPSEASQTVVAQSRDFNDFRRRLAQGVPATQVAGADRQATGTVKATVEDKKPAAATPDKLTLSKGALQAKAAEDKIARDRQAKEASVRVAELSKNISDLNKLGTSTVASSSGSTAGKGLAVGALPVASAPVKPASAPLVPTAPPVAMPATAAVTTTPTAAAVLPKITPTVAPVVAAVTATAATAVSKTAAISAVAAIQSASAPDTTAASVAATSATTAASSTTTNVAVEPAVVASAPAPAPIPKPAPAPPPPPSLVDEVLDNPLAIAGGLGILGALGGGFFLWRARQRRKATQVDSSFLESRLQPDSFFGASGGQRIDTNESALATGSSMVYSPSQLDAAGDVDPVAEADVYLAYGRDLQAEEILKEALRTTPARVAIHTKLLEIYAKRRDIKGFEFIASEAFSLTGGQGTDWERICELGQELDADNPLYRPGGQPQVSAGKSAPDPTAGYVPTAPFGLNTETASLSPQPDNSSSAPDLDFDLDFSVGDPPVPPSSQSMMATTPVLVEPTVAMKPVPEPVPSLDMAFADAAPKAAGAVNLAAPDRMMAGADLSFSADDFLLPVEPVKAAAAKVAQVDSPLSGMIEFDMASLSLDLDPKPNASANAKAAPAVAAAAAHVDFDDSSDGLSTKLALAEEFFTIGDSDGARSLAQEVVAEASGALKVKAQRFLAELS